MDGGRAPAHGAACWSSTDIEAAGSQGPEISAPRCSPSAFLPNEGQWKPKTAYVAMLGSLRILIGGDGVTLQRFVGESEAAPIGGPDPQRLKTVHGWNVALRFEGAWSPASFEEEAQQPGDYNFLLGSDRARWATHVQGCGRLVARDVYPGIDVVYRFGDSGFEYDLELEPGADLDAVRISISGDEGWCIDEEGSLVIRTGLGDCRQSRPLACESSIGGHSPQPLDVSYRQIDAHSFGFIAPSRDPLRRLVVDPAVVYSTLVGGAGPEFVSAVAAKAGTSWLVGSTYAFDSYPTTPGAFQVTGSVPVEGVITCLAPDGLTLVWSTFLGGTSLGDEVLGVDIAADGSPVVAGYTYGPSDFPLTQGSYDTTADGELDGFIARLTPDGSALTYSTLLGGASDEYCASVRLDAADNVYVTGTTKSADFPTTPGALLEIHPGFETTFVAELSADGSSLIYSTFIPGYARAKAMALDAERAVYLTGWYGGTSVLPIPLTVGAFDTTWNGNVDAYVVKLDPGGSSVGYATYLGGADWEEGRDIDVDADGFVYVTGKTFSFDYPTTLGAFDTTQAGSQNADTFVTKLDQAGSQLVFSTHLGDTQTEEARGVRVGSDGSIYAFGQTMSSPFPITPDAWQPVKMGDGDAYLVRFDPTGSSLTYGTYIGGSIIYAEEARALALDEHDNAFCVGETNSADFPTTPGAFDGTLEGFNDAFVVRFKFSPWEDVGEGLAGSGGLVPALEGFGTLAAGSAGSLQLVDALPAAPATLVVGITALNAPFKGGVLVPAPLLLVALLTDPAGEVLLSWSAWPAGIPSGTEVFFQTWVTDSGGPKGLAASQGLKAGTP